ncbi:MAG: putative porin, partial [Bacteroidaceae bacterium]|nr:putative porin [Bacteroidaceae bacterium]
KQIEVGGGINLVTGKGQYNHQADQEFSYRLFTSYIGEQYQIQAAFNHYDYVAAENGGITNDDFILDPASVQGGDKKVDARTIPTNLTSAFSHMIGHDLYVTHRYNLGYYKEVKESEEDTTYIEEFVPVSSIVHTLTYEGASHRFVNKSASEDQAFFRNTYLSNDGTNELSSYWAVANTLGMTVHEGLSKYFPMGLGVYATYEIRGYDQVVDTFAPGTQVSPNLTPIPNYPIAAHTTQHALWLGGQLWKRQGAWLTYEANARVGVVDAVLGDIDITGRIGTKIPLWNDSLSIQGNVLFKNTTPSYFYKQYISNHFIWDNDFGKIRRLRVGGEISFPKTGTYIHAGLENVQNYIYFGKECLPMQESSNIQVISATIKQNFKVSIFHLDLEGTYQHSTNQQVLPLPTFSAYGNFYLLFPIAKVLHVQLGVDCNWYSAFKAPAYQPALITRYNQDEIEIGNYPFMNVYLNAKLKKARFYIMYSHFNQGLFGGNNYFSIPHYPLNPALLQLGVSVDFAN